MSICAISRARRDPATTGEFDDVAQQVGQNPQTYSVHADGQLLTCEPALSLPMAQRYFLF